METGLIGSRQAVGGRSLCVHGEGTSRVVGDGMALADSQRLWINNATGVATAAQGGCDGVDATEDRLLRMGVA